MPTRVGSLEPAFNSASPRACQLMYPFRIFEKILPRRRKSRGIVGLIEDAAARLIHDLRKRRGIRLHNRDAGSEGFEQIEAKRFPVGRWNGEDRELNL